MVIAEIIHDAEQKAIREMQLSQIPKVAATFDEQNLISSGGLVPVMRLARRAGLEPVGHHEGDPSRWRRV